MTLNQSSKGEAYLDRFYPYKNFDYSKVMTVGPPRPATLLQLIFKVAVADGAEKLGLLDGSSMILQKEGSDTTKVFSR